LVTFLIRSGIIDPIIKGGKILVSETEITRYFNLPKPVRKKYQNSYLKTLGPGIITGAADDDCSGVVTYTQVGAQFGLAHSFLAVYLVPMMSAVQETCARIGIVTGNGLAATIKKHYRKELLFPLVALLVIANTVNIGADIGAMASALGLLLPINYILAMFIITAVFIFSSVVFPYQKYAQILKFLTLSLLAYIITGFIVGTDWLNLLKNMIVPQIVFSSSFFAALVAVMGTTISPYLFFWQASQEIEEERRNKIYSDHRTIVLKREIKEMRKDTYAGMLMSNIVFLFIVITAASVLHKNGVTSIETVSDAALALRPIAGNFAYLLFTIGIFGVGLLAVPVLAGSSAYAVAEYYGWKEGLSKKFDKAKGFYGVIILSLLIGLLINFIGINPMKALYYAAILNGLISPILMFFIFRIGRDEKIMGSFTSPRWVNIWGTIGNVLMAAAAVLMIALFFLS
jgi:Mn2+/Fe2+ NRAMP family transporter